MSIQNGLANLKINKQISLSKFAGVLTDTGDKVLVEFYPGIIEFNQNSIEDAIKSSYRENDSDYYLTEHSFDCTTKFYVRRYESYEDISHLFPSESETNVETIEDYRKRTMPEPVPWIEGLLDGTREVDLVIYRDQDIVISPDPKWLRPKSISNFYYLAMFTDRSLRSIRDLTGKLVPLLKKVKKQVLDEVKKDLAKLFNESKPFQANRIALFFHYPPQYWQLHLHVVNPNCVKQGHNYYLDDVISNLEIASDYYQNVTMTCVE
jgi:m7GpppX diphosphatase